MAEVNANEISYEEVCILNTPGLFTSMRVRRNSAPKGMQRYELRQEDGEVCQIAREVMVDHFGTLLTVDPIQLPANGYCQLQPEDLSFAPNGVRTLEDFQKRYPAEGRDVMELFVAGHDYAQWFFSWDEQWDVASGCIGHVRGDFSWDVLHHTWWPHYWDSRCNCPAFRLKLEQVVTWLRTGFAPMKNLEIMDAFCTHYAGAAIPGEDHAYGFRIETNQYRFMLRCTPVKGMYHIYLYCYGKEYMAQSLRAEKM